ncbi:MAG: hypothetical protein FJZ01_25690, partial [Candidatus Sericytochromatia bacterium]|nr:hypothetical protein [Candidatus Tanganyikabacteria bacterium]
MQAPKIVSTNKFDRFSPGLGIARAYERLEARLRAAPRLEDSAVLFQEWNRLKCLVAGEGDRRLAAFLGAGSNAGSEAPHREFQPVRIAAASADRRISTRFTRPPLSAWLAATFGEHLLSILEVQGGDYPDRYWRLAAAEAEAVSRLIALRTREPVLVSGQSIGLAE